MAATTMNQGSNVDNPITPWWMVLISGIAAIIVGGFLFARPVGTTLLLVQVMGWFWFFSGIMNIVMIFVDRRGWGWNLLLGILGIAAGLYIINNPVVGTITALVAIIWVLAFQAIAYGIISLIASFQGGGFGSAVLGILSIVLGILLLGNTLLSAATLPWVYGSFMIVGGIIAIFAAFRQRGQQKAVAAG
jgi:uncharacterized membrane protein HdeD (DUF308 family)